jgi:HAD superfamily hydrolase (TIGR01509 family)
LKISSKELHQTGMQLILASSASKLRLSVCFNTVHGGEDFPQSKPHLQFLNAASLSIAPKESCIVIEDSTNGVKAAKAAGILCGIQQYSFRSTRFV